MTAQPFLLFAQHGWDDNGKAIASLGQQLLTPDACLVAPSLNRLQTWLRLEPLVREAERHVIAATARAPQLPWYVLGHSMGGLIWLELLDRHPEWRSRVRAFVAIAAPLGGSDIARIIDPGGWGIGIARDLGRNRRSLAETIAAAVPMLAIAGDLGNGSDGTVPLGATQCSGAKWVCLPGLSHPQLRYRPESLPHIRAFWQDPVLTPPPTDPAGQLLQQLRALPGIIDTNHVGWARAAIVREFPGGLALRLRSWVGITRIYLSDRAGGCLYSGAVGPSQGDRLKLALNDLAVSAA